MSGKLTHLIILVLVVGFVRTSLGQGLDPDLAAWWRFDEGAGGVATDSSGHDLHGMLVDDPQWRSDGVRGGCLYFDGANAHVAIDHDTALVPLDGSFTILFWANVEPTAGTSGDTTWDLAVAKRDTGSVGYYVGALRTQGSADETGYRFMLGDTGASRRDTPFVTVPLGEWAFVAAVLDRDQDAQKISVDGGRTWQTTTPPAGSIAPAQSLGIGWDIGLNNYWFHGRVDDVALFARALADGEVNLIMRLGMTPELAGAAAPSTGATDVPADSTLSWTAGLYAASHDVYLGTSLADVTNASRTTPGDVLVSQGQSATTYDPGRLEFGQTYYWRVDEVNAAPDGTIFTGDVWQFTVEPFAYAIETIEVTTNGISDPGKGPEKMLDGSGLNADDQHSTSSSDMWLADNFLVSDTGDQRLWVQYEFVGVYKLHEMLVWNYNVEYEQLLGFGIQNATFEYSTDGADWTVLGDVELAQGTGVDDYTANTTIDFGGAAVKYVKMTVNNGFGGMGQYGLSEVRFLYVPIHPREPQPADESIEVSAETTLNWRGGREAALHEVYLGTDANTLPLIDTVQATRYAPAALDLGTTYYWQIVEVNEAEAISTWAGEIWSFSTAEYLIVDDFEGYTDMSPSVLFQTWVDGWGFEADDFLPNGNDGNGSGAQVGYLQAPYAERAVVHSGAQSMPLVYDNTSVDYSEATRTFASPQDWTRYGVQTLNVYFRGDADNAGQLYVKINDVKVIYDGPAEDIAAIVWQAWSIDLSTVGTNLTNIRTLTIGVDGAGTAGTLYVDDIRLYRVTSDVTTEPDSASLIAHYAFDGDLADSSGNGHDGEIGGEPVFVAGMKGQALQFDGIDDFVRVPHQDDLDPGDGSFSVSFWAYLDPAAGSSGTSEWDLAIAKRGSSSARGYYIGANRNQGESGQAGYKFMLGNTAGQRVDTPYVLVPTDEWVFVTSVLDREQNVHKISVNAAGTWAVATPPADAIALTDDLTIGWDIGQNNYWYHGTIDDVRFYDTALTDAEVAWLANN